MRAAFGRIGGAVCVLFAVAACGGGDPQLMNLRKQTAGPDEFAILPGKPLEMPPDLAALPAPTPGGANRTDPTPQADAIAALGGRPATGIPAADSALLAHVSRHGVTPDIRTQLAAEDLDYRRRNDGRLLERVLNVNVYYNAYKPMSLDKYAELERWRRLGVRTVGAPPKATN